jgi:hypothetical protein
MSSCNNPYTSENKKKHDHTENTRSQRSCFLMTTCSLSRRTDEEPTEDSALHSDGGGNSSSASPGDTLVRAHHPGKKEQEKLAEEKKITPLAGTEDSRETNQRPTRVNRRSGAWTQGSTSSRIKSAKATEIEQRRPGCRRPAGEPNPQPRRSKHRAEKDELLDAKTRNRPMMATGTHARGKTDSTPEQKTSRRTGRESKDRSNRNWIQPQPQATDQVRMREKRGLRSNSNLTQKKGTSNRRQFFH